MLGATPCLALLAVGPNASGGTSSPHQATGAGNRFGSVGAWARPPESGCVEQWSDATAASPVPSSRQPDGTAGRSGAGPPWAGRVVQAGVGGSRMLQVRG